VGQIGDGASRQRRISYRKCRNRPSQLIPPASGHDPAFFPSQVQDRRALDDESVVREPDLQRGVVAIQSRAMLDKRLQRLKEPPLKRTTYLPAPRGIQ
jgi:hypothetical protein